MELCPLMQRTAAGDRSGNQRGGRARGGGGDRGWQFTVVHVLSPGNGDAGRWCRGWSSGQLPGRVASGGVGGWGSGVATGARAAREKAGGGIEKGEGRCGSKEKGAGG